MTDVNLTDLLARAVPSHLLVGRRRDQTTREVADAVLAALADPVVVAGIAGVVLAEQYPAHDPDDRSDDWQVRQAESVARAVVEWITKDA